jgi:integrase
MAGRPRTPIGTFGAVNVRRRERRVMAETRFRDADGRLRRVTASAASAAAARSRLKEKLRHRPGYGNGGTLQVSSSFSELANLWLADLELRDLAEGTRHGYREHFRLHVRPGFDHYTLGEITTGRVEWFLKSQASYSTSRAKQSRTLLNLVFAFALRHDAMSRNPVQGTSPLARTKAAPRALTLEQIALIRTAAATWRSDFKQPGPKNDGQVRDIIEVLLGTATRTGEVLALRPCDVTDGPAGMVAHVNGTVVQRKGIGALRQDRPKTDASIRHIPVPEFAAVVLRRRLATIGAQNRDRTIFATRTGGPLSPYNVRRTFRDLLKLAGLGETGISLRWYRRTGATVIARSMGSGAAATFLGHSSTAVTEGHYIERDRTVDPTPAAHLERTLRPDQPDDALLTMAPAEGEDEVLAIADDNPDVGGVA